MHVLLLLSGGLAIAYHAGRLDVLFLCFSPYPRVRSRFRLVIRNAGKRFPGRWCVIKLVQTNVGVQRNPGNVSHFHRKRTKNRNKHMEEKMNGNARENGKTITGNQVKDNSRINDKGEENQMKSSSKKSIVVVGVFTVLLLASVISHAVMFNKLNKNEVAIRDFKKLQIAVPKELYPSIQKSFTEFKNESLEEVDTLMKDIKKISQEKIEGNEKLAEEAFGRAKKFVEKKDFDSAKLYCLNAINHNPNKKEYFQELLNITDRYKQLGIDDLEVIQNILKLSLYQVDSENIPGIKDMLSDISKKMDFVSKKNEQELLSENEQRTEKTINAFKTGILSWEELIKTKENVRLLESAKKRLEGLEALLSIIDSSSQEHQEQIKWCEGEVPKTKALLEYAVIMNSIEAPLKKAESLCAEAEGNKSDKLPAVNSMIQTANGFLSQAWNIHLEILPENFNESLQKQASRIAALEVKFHKLKSQPAFDKIKAIEENITDISINEKDKTKSKYTKGMKSIQGKIHEIMTLLPGVYDLEMRREIEKNLNQYSEKIKELNAERYKKYQEWAKDKCKEGFAKYRAWKRVDEVDAIQVISEYLLEIDVSLLAPEVSRLYSNVLEKQFEELSKGKKVDWQVKLATGKKKSLEDF